jgi:xanthine dehydrogenase accessory factor
MKNARTIFRFLNQARARAENCALVTITDVLGQAPRAPGTHLGVSESGAFAGSLSSGCLEAAVVAEAQRVIRTGQAEMLPFGAGSPFIDIRLPCGGGMTLLITPNPSASVITQAENCLADRVPVTLALSRHGPVRLTAAPRPAGWRDDSFLAPHLPDLRLFIAGHGAETIALARLAQAAAIETIVISPDAAILEAASALGLVTHGLPLSGRVAALQSDALSALVTLFHDHALETELLAQVLAQESLMVGAMGSRQTHARRLAALRQRGVPAERLNALIGPIGLIPGARDPETLALSVLAQVVSQHERALAMRTEPMLPAGWRGTAAPAAGGAPIAARVAALT